MKINLTQLHYAQECLQHFQQGLGQSRPVNKTGLWSPRVAGAVDQFSMRVNHTLAQDFYFVCQNYQQKIGAYVQGIKDCDRLRIQTVQEVKEEL